MKYRSVSVLFFVLLVACATTPAEAQQACGLPQEVLNRIGRGPALVIEEARWHGPRQGENNRYYSRANYDRGYVFFGGTRVPLNPSAGAIWSDANPPKSLATLIVEEVERRLMGCGVMPFKPEFAQAGQKPTFVFTVSVATVQETEEQKGKDGNELARILYQAAIFSRNRDVNHGLAIGAAAASGVNRQSETREVVLSAHLQGIELGLAAAVVSNKGTARVTTRELSFSNTFGWHNTVYDHPNAHSLAEGLADALFSGR